MEIDLPYGPVLRHAIDEPTASRVGRVGDVGERAAAPVETGAPAQAARPDGRGLRRRARLRGWKLPITDGPFAESKEM
jgi:hypothetical protein